MNDPVQRCFSKTKTVINYLCLIGLLWKLSENNTGTLKNVRPVLNCLKFKCFMAAPVELCPLYSILSLNSEQFTLLAIKLFNNLPMSHLVRCVFTCSLWATLKIYELKIKADCRTSRSIRFIYDQL